MSAKYVEAVCKACQQPRYVRKGNGLCATCHTTANNRIGMTLANQFPNPRKPVS